MSVARNLAFLAGISLAQLDLAHGAVIYQTVALTGQQAPGMATGTVYLNSFSGVSINSSGQVVFSSQVTGFGNNALYSGLPGSLQLVARTGDQAPGLAAGVRFLHFHKYDLPQPLNDYSVINDSGDAVFLAKLAGPGLNNSNNDAVYFGSSASLQLVARKGDQAAGTPAGVVYGTPLLHLNDAGQVGLFDFLLTGPGVSTANRSAVFVGTPGAMQLVARDGDPSPGNTATYGGSGGIMRFPTFNDLGQVVFSDDWSGPGYSNSTSNAIFGGGVGSMQLIARGGNQPPDAPAGLGYLHLDNLPGINDSGQVAYASRWTTGVGGVDSTNDVVLYAGPMASPSVIAREGDQAPGTAPGTTYSTFFPGSGSLQPTPNDAGGIFFGATLAGAGVSSANDIAFFAGPWNAPQLILREGDPAPDTAPGITFTTHFSGTFDGSGYPGVTFNDLGQAATLLILAGGVTSANDGALYLFDPVLGPIKIAREGDQFDIGGGVMRTIADGGIVFSAGYNDDFVNGLSNTGKLVFGLKFTNGTSGIFTTTVPIPEPTTLALLGLVGLLGCVRMRK
jgi:PEP-CTERM motif